MLFCLFFSSLAKAYGLFIVYYQRFGKFAKSRSLLLLNPLVTALKADTSTS